MQEKTGWDSSQPILAESKHINVQITRRGMSKESTSTFWMRKGNGYESFQPSRAGNCPETESAVPEINTAIPHIDPNESPMP
jgi:hypothetical protein